MTFDDNQIAERARQQDRYCTWWTATIRWGGSEIVITPSGAGRT